MKRLLGEGEGQQLLGGLSIPGGGALVLAQAVGGASSVRTGQRRQFVAASVGRADRSAVRSWLISKGKIRGFDEP